MTDTAMNQEGRMERAGKAFKLTLGWRVFAGLMALTVLEFWVAAWASGPIPYPILCGALAPITWFAVWASKNPLPYLVIIALAKGALIVRYFMHVAQLWATEAEGGH